VTNEDLVNGAGESSTIALAYMPIAPWSALTYPRALVAAGSQRADRPKPIYVKAVRLSCRLPAAGEYQQNIMQSRHVETLFLLQR